MSPLVLVASCTVLLVGPSVLVLAWYWLAEWLATREFLADLDAIRAEHGFGPWKASA